MNNKDLDFYFNPQYAKVYENIDGKSETFCFSCQYGSIQNTYILREIPYRVDGNIYFDIVTPYGYGGPVVLQCSDIKLLMEEYQKAFTEYCMEHHIVCEFIRFHLFDNVDARENFYGETAYILDNVIVNTTGKYDDIWLQYAYKVRKNVKKAMSNGLQIFVEHNLTHIEDFLGVYYETMERNHAKSYYYFSRDFFENIAELLPKNFVYFYVLKDEEVISTELVLYSDKYAYSFLGGTKEEYYSMRPNDFLKTAVIQWCNETGKEKFILGGGYQKEDGIYRYKRSFTTDDDVPFYIGKMIYNQNVYDRLVCERKKEDSSFDEKASYFPLYRA